MAKNKVQCLYKKDAEDIYVIQTLDLGLRTDCFLTDAFVKRKDEDGTEWSVSYDYLEYAIQYENAEDAMEAAKNITEMSPSEHLEVISLAKAEKSVELLTSTTTNPKDLPTIVPPKILKGPEVSMEEEPEKEWRGIFEDLGMRRVSSSKSLAEDSSNISLGFEDEEDVVNHPAHYENDKYQCIDVMEDIYGTEAVMNFCMCNAFKYIWRFQKKNGIEDIQKAQWYMNKYQELAEKITKEAEE